MAKDILPKMTAPAQTGAFCLSLRRAEHVSTKEKVWETIAVISWFILAYILWCVAAAAGG